MNNPYNTALSFVDLDSLSLVEIRRKFDELRAYNIELETQNVELRKSTNQRLAEQNYRTLFREMLNGFALHEIICENGVPADYRFLDINPAYERITGLRKADIIGRTVLEIMPNTEPYRIESYGRVALTGESIHFDNSDGQRHFEVTAFQPKPGQFACIFNDLTERKRAEEHLIKYKNIVSSTQDGIALLDTNYRYTILNKSYERYSGINQEKIIGMTVAGYLGEDVFQLSIKPHFDRCLQGETINYQEWFDYPVLGRRFVDVTYTPYRDMNNCIAGVVSNTRDITEQCQAQDTVARSESKYRELFEANQDAITIFRIEPDRTAGKFLDMNQAALKLGGHLKEEYRDLRPSNFEKDASEETIKKRLAEIEFNGHAHFETVITNKAGDEIPVEIQVRQIPFEGKPAMMNIIRDIRTRKHMENALRESERNFRNLADCGQALIWTSGTDKLCNYFNQVWLEFTGRALDQELGNGWVEGVFPEDLQRCLPIYTGAFDRREKFSVEYRLRRYDREYRWLVDEGCPRYNSTGEFIGYIGHCLDITERKLAEEEVRSKDKQLSELSSRLPGLVFQFIARHDGTRTVTYVTGQVEKILGLSPEPQDFLERFTAAIHSEQQNDFLQNIEKVVSEGTEWNYEVEIQKPSGEILWVSGIASPTKMPDSIIYDGVIIDISERKRAEEELRRRENQLQRIFEILPIGLWFADKDGILLRGNPKGIEIWGAEPTVPPSEYGMFKAYRLPSREPIEANQWALAKTICNGETIVDELLEIESFDGKRKTILNYTAPVLDGDGRVDGAIVVNLDISDRKVLEDRLLQAQKMESIGQLAGGVAHDFNNMLGVIRGYTEMALEKLYEDDPLHKDLSEVLQAAERSADLTRQLLTFARKQTIAPKVIDINETVEGMLKMLRRLIGEDIDLIWLPGRNLYPVKMDPTQIDQILANLCINARDAIEGVGKVTIETGLASFDAARCAVHTGVMPGEYVLRAVSDNGGGMDQEIISHLFEPFFTTKEQGKGTGLGLASVYGAVTQNNGCINVYSEPGKGTTFKVFLPRHMITPESLLVQIPVKAAARGFETILLVEDEPAILEMTTIMLELQGYTVVAAGTPGEAIRLAEEHTGQIDMLMTDIVMPEMNGRDLAGRITSLYPGIKLLFMSGYPANIIAQQGVLDDGVEFIQKPFSKADMAVKLREALEG